MARGKKAAQGLTPEEKLAQALVPVEEQPYPIPENWCWTRLFGVIVSSDEKTEEFSNLELKYVGLENLEKDGGIIGYGSPEGIKSLKNVFHSGQILYGKLRPYLNKHDIATFDGICSTDILVFSTREPVLPQIVNYYFNQSKFIEYVVGNSKGINLPRVSENVILNAVFPLPPLAEQWRIVDRIESIFAKLDEAKEKAQAVVDGFELRKSSILHRAFTGELTAKWRETEAIKNQWEIKKFRNFCLLKRGYDLPASQRIKGVYPLVSSSGVIDAHCEYKVKGPGVITGRSGTIGKVFIVNEDYWPLNTTLYSENLFGNDPFYVYYYLQTFDFKTYSSSTAVPTLNRNMFLDVEVSVPTLKEQAEIVRILDKLLAKENAAKEAAESVLDQIDTMKKAVLARAFRGELGTNDPAEESAVELLKTML
jgi:type I restriction enzyme S subunit